MMMIMVTTRTADLACWFLYVESRLITSSATHIALAIRLRDFFSNDAVSKLMRTRFLDINTLYAIGVARGCTGCTRNPQGGEKSGPNLQG